MIGRDFQDLYVAACSLVCQSYAEGKKHEHACPECQGIIHPPKSPDMREALEMLLEACDDIYDGAIDSPTRHLGQAMDYARDALA